MFCVSAAYPADAQIATGGNYTLDQSVIASGGGNSSSGNFKIEGTAGQSAAGTRQINVPYNFYSGFWTAQPTFAPTAAGVTVGGRVLMISGQGIRNARITMTSGNGETRSAVSGTSAIFILKTQRLARHIFSAYPPSDSLSAIRYRLVPF